MIHIKFLTMRNLMRITLLLLLALMGSTLHAQGGWQKVYVFGGAPFHVVCNTPDGGYAQIHASAGEFSPNTTQLHKVDQDGVAQWQKTYATPGISKNPRNFLPLAAGGYLITGGYADQSGSNKWDAMLLKTDASGDLVEQKGIGGIENESASQLYEAANGDIFLAGEINADTTQFDNDVFLMKTNAIIFDIINMLFLVTMPPHLYHRHLPIPCVF